MSDKFKVGQPVWAIGHVSGSWWPGTVTKQRALSITDYDPVFRLRYIVHLPTCPIDALKNPVPNGLFSCTEDILRPRDPDQFKSADPAYEWRNQEVHA